MRPRISSAAPNLFTDELDEALLSLERTPTIGARYELKPGVRRLLLRRTRHHLYFIEAADRLYVLAIWGTSQGRGPRL